MDLPANYEKHVIVCQLCDKVLVKPKSLQCLHSFCSSCLLTHFKNIPEDSRADCSFHCPSCKTVTKLPVSDVPVDSWLPLLPNSLLLSSLIEKVSLEEVKSCDPCSRGDIETNAMSWCYDCGEALCKQCVTYHQRMKVLMEHTVLDLEEIRNKPHKMAETAELCQTHAGKVVQAFCYDHDYLCCLDCVTYGHRKCQKVKSLNEIASGIKDSGVVNAIADKLKWVEDHAMAVVNSRTNTIEELSRKQDAILSEVASLRDEIETLLQQMEEKLKEELSKMHEAMVEQLKVQSKDFEYICKAAENGKRVLAVSNVMGAENEVYVTTQKLRRRCKEHEIFMNSESSRIFNYNYEFVVNDVINEFTKNVLSVGKINIMRAPDNTLPAFLKDRRIEKLLEINGKCPADNNHCWFTGGLFTSTGFLVLADYRNRKLKCFKETSGMVSSLDLHGQPWDVCELANGQLAVTVPDESTITLVTLSSEGEVTRSGEMMEVGTGCHGIRPFDETLTVACSNEIRVLDTDGQLQRTHPLEERGTRYVMADGENVIFTDNVGITSKTVSGSNVFKYRDSELRSPRGFTRDHEGNFYVCGMDSNNVLQLTKDGLLNKVLLAAKDGIRNPYAIGFQPEGTTLFLTQMDCDVVYLYKLVTRCLLCLSSIRILNTLNTTRCPKVMSGNVAFSVTRSNGFQDKFFHSPLTDYRYTYEKLGEHHVVFRHVLVNYPYHTLSVHEPLQPGGCHSNRTLVTKTTEHKSCVVAMNAGFFYEHGAGAGCFGNIISDGNLVRNSGGTQNVYFGIKKNGDIFTGYLTEADVAKENFVQLVSGVIWLIRDGKININKSLDYECPEALKGSIQNFSSSLSARSAVAVDKQGRVILMQVDGNTNERGRRHLKGGPSPILLQHKSGP